MSCQIITSGNKEVNLHSVMRGFGDVASLDFGRPALHSGLHASTWAKQNSSRSSCVRDGVKIDVAWGMGRCYWNDDNK